MPVLDPRLPRVLHHCWAGFAVAVAAYVAVLGFEWAAGLELIPIETLELVQFALLVAGNALILGRAFTIREARIPWLIVGLGFVAWSIGLLVSALASPEGQEAGFPSALDVGALIGYAAQYVGFFLLARSHLQRVQRSAWLDGVTGTMLLGTLGAQWLLVPMLDAGETVTGAAIAIAYPAADLILLALVLAVILLHGGRAGAPWLALAAGLVCTTVGDLIFAVQAMSSTAAAATRPLSMLYALWVLGLVAAPMLSSAKRVEGTMEGWRSLAAPMAFSVMVVALIGYDAAVELTQTGEILLTICAGLICYRFALAFRENIRLADSHRQALSDELTGLPNRRAAYAELDDRCSDGGPVAVLMIDLDRFKELNDTLGHLAGDEVLVTVGWRLQAEIADAGHLCRLGGDEFAVVLAPGAGEHEAMALARRLLDALDEPLYLEGMALPLRASIGVATSPGGAFGGGRETLLRHADVAMYHAKGNGSGVELYAPERDDHSRERLELTAEMQEAITSGQLVLHFQPKASLRTGDIVGVEALVRWEHPARGLVYPDEFIGLVERSGLGRLLTLEVISQALQAERVWRNAGMNVPVAVNTSAATLLDLRFPDDVAGLLERWDAPAGSLSLELTEETIMTDPERAQDVLARLSELGIDLSLDDFGTGYSSLNMLKRLPVRELKIDRSFVMDLLDDAEDAAIVRSTVEMSRNLGLRVVAEGVESAEAWDLLAEWGCDVAQGYHLSRPVPEAELRALLVAHTQRAA
jgi:diguanylate cyclase (GGDEF)-like protein